MPEGTVTFLFTDVESSTPLWEQQAAVMAEALARHDELTRAVIDDHDGFVFATAGDSFSAAFARATDAVAAAVDLQRVLAREHWPAATPIRVRVGVHTGEAHERDGDYFGPAVNRAARIMALGSGGCVLLSAVTAELVTAGEFDVRPVGSVRLRGMLLPESVSQVVFEGMPDGVPMLRFLEVPGNVPPDRDLFVGRDSEVAEIVGLLSEHRLVTLVGPGGVGKTRLATRCAGQVAAQFSDGVWLVELAEVGGDDEVAAAVVATLGLRPQSDATLAQSVVDIVSGQQLLLVLDNCEHVLDGAAALVDGLLGRPGRAVVMATSREGLAVPGERMMPIRPLPTNAGSAAEVLFLDRAANAGWSASPEDREVINEICVRLDGIPLAIELAAARARSMPLADLVQRLNDRFELLGSGRRGLDRHRTLQTTLDWSHGLLDENEREVFDRLAVFFGPFTADDLVEVCGDGDERPGDLLNVVGSLVDKSMVIAESTGYRLLETMRQYGQRQLGAGEAAKLHRRHLDHYVRLAHQANEGLWGPDDAAWESRLRHAWPNSRAAIEFAIEDSNVEAAATLLSGDLKGHVSDPDPEIGRWVLRALEVDGIEAAQFFPALLATAGFRELSLGDFDAARKYTERAQRALAQGGTDFGWSVGNLRASIQMLTGDTDDSATGMKALAAHAEQAGNPARQAHFLGGAAYALSIGGRWAEAVDIARRAKALAEGAQNSGTLAWTRFQLGSALVRTDPVEARNLLEQVIEYTQPLGWAFFVANAHVDLATLLVREGEIVEAVAVALEPVPAYRRSGSWGYLWALLWLITPILMAAGHATHVAQLLGAVDETWLAKNPRNQRRLDELHTGVVNELGDALAAQLIEAGRHLTPSQAAEIAESVGTDTSSTTSR